MELNEQQLAEMDRLAALGLVQRDIAASMKLKAADLSEHKERIKINRAKGKADLKAKAVEVAAAGNPGLLAQLTRPKVKTRVDRMKKKEERMLLASSEYVESDQGLALNMNGEISLDAELRAYTQTIEGAKLVRKAIQAGMIKAAHGDSRLLTTLFNRLDGQATKTVKNVDLNDAADQIGGGNRQLTAQAMKALSGLPADQLTSVLLQLDNSSTNVIDAELVEARLDVNEEER